MHKAVPAAKGTATEYWIEAIYDFVSYICEFIFGKFEEILFSLQLIW